MSLTECNVLRFVCTYTRFRSGITVSSIAKKLRLPVTFFFYGTPAHFRSMASSNSFLQHFLSFAVAFQFRIWSKSTASFIITSSHLPLGFAQAFFLRNILPLVFWGYQDHLSLLVASTMRILLCTRFLRG